MADVANGRSDGLAGARDWLLLDGNRLLIASGLLVALYLLLSMVEVIASDASLSQGPLTRLLAALIGGNLTLITVVIAINQLVLSRELRTPKALTEEIDAAVEYRDDVAATVQPRPRAEAPADFLEHLLVRLDDAVDRLDAATGTIDDPAVAERCDGIVRSLDHKVATMRTLLGRRGVDLFTALATILRYNLAPEYNGCRWLQRVHGPDLDEEAVGALANAQQRVTDLEIGRHYVKTIYVQIELAKLSRLLLYVGAVALTAATLGIVGIGVDPGTDPWLIRIAITLCFGPFALLLAYILRIATVAERTAAFVPFGRPD